jgi:hypothetical protein
MKNPKKAKKLTVKKETLRTLDDTEAKQLDAVAGGTTPVCVSISVSLLTTLLDSCNPD